MAKKSSGHKVQGGKRDEFLDFEVLEPPRHRGQIIQLHVAQPKAWKTSYAWTLRKLLDLNFHEPTTLEDCGMTLTAVEKVQQSLYNIWTGGSSSTEFEMGEQATTSTSNSDGPFDDPQKNQVWRVLASQMMALYDELADVDMLEPDPTNRKAALKRSRLAPFWIASEQKELTGLWSRDCFKRWKRGDLLKSDSVFGSRFHYHIKRDPKTGLITNCKVRLVVQGNTLKAGEDFKDAFSPVPHATAGHIIISLAAANDWELHCCDLAQAFIQADKLPEGVNGRVFIRPPAGAEKDDAVVYEVLRPL